MRRDAKRNSDYRERNTCKRKRKPFIDFGAAGAAFAFVLAFQLLQQLFDGQRRSARPFFLFVVKLLEADRQCAFHHIDSVAYLSQVGRVLWVALLITRLIQVHQDLLVCQVGFEHAGARVSHLHRHGVLVQLEYGDVLELVTLFFPNIDFAPGKLIDHLIAAKERHWIARGEIENGAAQFFLCCRRDLHIEPETHHSARQGDAPKRKTHAWNTDAVRAQRDQFVVRRKAPKHEQNRRQQSPGNREDE